MRRRLLRLLVLVLVVALVGGMTAIVFTTKPNLDDQRDQIDARWDGLRQPLITRYQALAGVAKALHDAGAGERTVTKELDATLVRWGRLIAKAKRVDPAAQATAANELEALATRTTANVADSDRLNSIPPLKDALNAFALATVPPESIQAYNGAVREYQRTRDDRIDGFVAALFGYEARPTFVIG